jgi:hypothetical protein
MALFVHGAPVSQLFLKGFMRCSPLKIPKFIGPQINGARKSALKPTEEGRTKEIDCRRNGKNGVEKTSGGLYCGTSTRS